MAHAQHIGDEFSASWLAVRQAVHDRGSSQRHSCCPTGEWRLQTAGFRHLRNRACVAAASVMTAPARSNSSISRCAFRVIADARLHHGAVRCRVAAHEYRHTPTTPSHCRTPADPGRAAVLPAGNEWKRWQWWEMATPQLCRQNRRDHVTEQHGHFVQMKPGARSRRRAWRRAKWF
jgi:hypothetical protein